MRNLSALLLLAIISCSKEPAGKDKIPPPAIAELPTYDTVAIDSFSPGATSVDVAAEIRRSSRLYQDSVQRVRNLAAEAELLKKAKETEAKKEAEKQKSQDNKTKEQNRSENSTEVPSARPNE